MLLAVSVSSSWRRSSAISFDTLLNLRKTKPVNKILRYGAIEIDSEKREFIGDVAAVEVSRHQAERSLPSE